MRLGGMMSLHNLIKAATGDRFVWEERWSGQNQYLEDLCKYLSANLTIPRIKTLHTVAQSLQAFAYMQIAFFKKGFTDDKFEMGDDCEYSAEAVFDIIIKQIGFDISVIEKAAHQRIRSYQSGQGSQAESVYRALTIGDHLANESLQLAQKLMRVETTVVTYLNKSANVRVIPYAPVILVGIPYSCIHVTQDFLAVPHEVGHHIYRHGRFDQEKNKVLEKKLPRALLPSGVNQWTKDWFEEIFADVFGALAAGPVIGLDFQDLQMAKKIDSFYEDKEGGDHPVPMLRPYIYNNALYALHPAWVEKLAANWQNCLEQQDNLLPSEVRKQPGNREAKAKGRKFKRKDGHLFDVAKAISTVPKKFAGESDKPLNVAINLICEQLLKDVPANSWPPNLEPPKTVNGEEETVKELYIKFENYINSLVISADIPELTFDKNNVLAMKGRHIQRKVGETLFPNRIENVIQRIDQLGEKEKICYEEWLRVLSAAGWATLGPDCDGSGGVNC